MNSYQEEFRIRYSDCDRLGKLKLKALFDYAQEIAGIHATRLGFGNQLREQRQLAWVLSRMKLRILEYPVSETTVNVMTWPSGFNRVFATREYRFSIGERVFAEGSSDWILLDMRAMKIAIPQRELADCLVDYSDAEHVFQNLDKLAGHAEAPVIGEYSIYEHQIDVNGHLNNAEYASLLQDALGIGVYPRELQINYQKEIPPQSLVTIRGTRDERQFVMTGFLGDVEAFNAVGTLE